MIFRSAVWTSHRNNRIGTVKLSAVRLGEAGVIGSPAQMTTPRDRLFAGYRYSAGPISYAVWLDFQFPAKPPMVEEMLAARGLSVIYERIRQWGLEFGGEFANRIRRRAPRRSDKWQIDEQLVAGFDGSLLGLL
jgi:hypothetical protein